MPYILFSVCLCARFQSDPRESHLTVVKRIFRYLKGTTNLGLLYKKSLDYKLIGFCDADYAGDRIEKKSTSGNCQFLGENQKLHLFLNPNLINHLNLLSNGCY